MVVLQQNKMKERREREHKYRSSVTFGTAENAQVVHLKEKVENSKSLSCPVTC